MTFISGDAGAALDTEMAVMYFVPAKTRDWRWRETSAERLRVADRGLFGIDLCSENPKAFAVLSSSISRSAKGDRNIALASIANISAGSGEHRLRAGRKNRMNCRANRPLARVSSSSLDTGYGGSASWRRRSWTYLPFVPGGRALKSLACRRSFVAGGVKLTGLLRRISS